MTLSQGIIKKWLLLFVLCFSMIFAITPINKASALSYDYSNPYSTGCADKSPITYETKYIYSRTGVKIGYVQLKGSAYCHTAWGYVKFYSAAPYNYYAKAIVNSYTNGTTRRTFTDCASSGGNGMVMKGQTSCYTPQLWDKDPYKASAEVWIYTSDGWGTQNAITGRH
ncbi:DUF2690 domain-containing protein [Peribacillus butanolivorans]|uniref:DUF2690 domain-containing protein n=1 Tax=Peribacillus simplex TaxID=1478 RepID=A0AAW7IY98_9BACI|nr:DUF2690 domain-containing protein [Peribacillus simplex]MDM5455398.1 DUF2690 domain-containing protein [Peribacillus simplex]